MTQPSEELLSHCFRIGVEYGKAPDHEYQRAMAAETQRGIQSVVPPVLPDPPKGETLQLTSHGITWYLEGVKEHGTYLNGDHWVVGPVVVTRISPSGTTHSGSMVNPDIGRLGGQVPGSVQGYDQDVYGKWHTKGDFDPKLNVAAQLPYTLGPGDSLVSTISRNPYRPNLQTAAVLTVVGEAPPEGSFRPSYSAGEKKHYTWEQVQGTPWNGPTPKLATVQMARQATDGVWLRHGPFYLSRELGPVDHMTLDGQNYFYSADMTAVYGTSCLVAGTDPALLTNLIQIGIDFYGVARRAMETSPPDGDPEVLFRNKVPRAALTYPGAGQSSGYKWPILFAGSMLGEQEMIDITKSYKMMGGPVDYLWSGEGVFWGEDFQCFINFAGDPDWGSNMGLSSRAGRYSSSWEAPDADPYRFVNGGSWWGQVAAAELLGLREAWDHEPLFLYTRRYYDWVKSQGITGAARSNNVLFGDLAFRIYEEYVMR